MVATNEMKEFSSSSGRWNIYGDDWETGADFTNGTKSVRFAVTNDSIVRFARTWIIQINDPTWTNITGKIHMDEGGSVGELLHSSSTTHAKGDIFTLDEGAAEIYFEFDDISLNADTWYQFVLSGTGYSPAAGKMLAWKMSYPDPVYRDGFGVSFGNIPVFPYDFVLIGADF